MDPDAHSITGILGRVPNRRPSTRDADRVRAERQLYEREEPAQSRNRLVPIPSFWLLRRRLDLSHDERLLA